MKYPQPYTKRAILMSEEAGRPTKHRFVGTRRVVLPTPDGEAFEFLFQCEETGTIRRWGTQDIISIDEGN